ncbi:MAG TPA: hypothetical protein DIU07_20365 [Rhodobacteraceae bacterium]|nr:hypothetical protein [Paracoccaceae bacterium]
MFRSNQEEPAMTTPRILITPAPECPVAMAKVSGKPALGFEAFHAKGQPCMRASPLTKRYGWAAHFDVDGRLALVDPASADFATLAADPDLATKPAMRS